MIKISADLIATIVAVVIGLVAYIGYKIASTRNRQDPDYERKVAEREREYRRRREEEESLDEYVNSSNDY